MHPCFASDNKGVLTSYCKSWGFAASFTPQFEFISQYLCASLSTSWRGKFLGDKPQNQNCILFDNFHLELNCYFTLILFASFSNWSSLTNLLANYFIYFFSGCWKRGDTQPHTPTLSSPSPIPILHRLIKERKMRVWCTSYLLNNRLWRRQ